MDWREHLTDLFERRWLKDHSQYRIKLRNEPDNPDQRIQEDCAELSERTIVLVKYFIMNAFKLIAFISILWGLSGVQHIEFMGIEWEINGYLVWVALLWSVLCTIATHLIGRKLKGASINSESQFFHFADSTQNNAESLSTDPMLRLFCRGSC